jgi:acyl-CoA synthetase (AMP-forming)/AMP-acid ligase II
VSALWHDLPDAQAAKRPGARALVDTTGADWSWSDLKAASEDLAQVLAGAGVTRGDRVLILAENCNAAVAALYAATRLGAAAIPINARQTAPEVDRVIAHATPAAILTTAAVSPDAAAHAARLGATPVEGRFGALQMTRRTSDPEGVGDVAVVLYTTGTTGTPKGVMLTHDNLIFGGTASATLRAMTADDLIYGVLPITHVFGLASIVTAAAVAGARIRFEPRFAAAKLYAALTEGVTLLSAVPQMHALLMEYTREQGFDRLPGGTLRYVSSGAAPLDPTWKRKAESFYGVALQNGYGMTETTAGVSITQSAFGDPDTSTGPALPGVEIVIDESVPGGGDGAGEVVVRGANIMKGYFRNTEATAAALSPDGWLRTGDLGRIDGQGRLHILGRSKELIIHGGFNVYPPEVEAALNDHPQVIQSAVIGRMEGGDEKVLAFVQVAEGCDLTEADLRAFVADRLAGYKRPARIVLATSLPAAPTGKILKHRLLDAFADRLG